MATSTEVVKEGFESSVQGTENVTFRMDGSIIEVQGPLGKCAKDFSKIPVTVKIDGSRIVVNSSGKRRSDVAVVTTACSIIKKMIIGVTEGFTYRLKVVFAHFPVSVKVKGGDIQIENFYGERSPRVAKIAGDCRVSAEGDDVVVQGVSLEDVGQTAANIEQATTVKRKDQRIFLDGIYVYDKRRGWK